MVENKLPTTSPMARSKPISRDPLFEPPRPLVPGQIEWYTHAVCKNIPGRRLILNLRHRIECELGALNDAREHVSFGDKAMLQFLSEIRTALGLPNEASYPEIRAQAIRRAAESSQIEKYMLSAMGGDAYIEDGLRAAEGFLADGYTLPKPVDGAMRQREQVRKVIWMPDSM